MGESLHSIEQCHATFSISVVSMGIVEINCIRCANYFSIIVDENEELSYQMYLINIHGPVFDSSMEENFDMYAMVVWTTSCLMD